MGDDHKPLNKNLQMVKPPEVWHHPGLILSVTCTREPQNLHSLTKPSMEHYGKGLCIAKRHTRPAAIQQSVRPPAKE